MNLRGEKMTKKEAFEELAEKTGIECKNYSTDRVNVTYDLPRNHPSGLSSFSVLGPKIKSEEEEKGCVLNLYFDSKRLLGGKTVFYLNSVTEAYAILFAVVYMPKKIRYEVLRGRERTKVSREEFHGRGKRVISIFDLLVFLPAPLELVHGILVLVLRFLFFPILSLLDMIFRSDEFLFDKVGDEFVLTRHRCFGPFNKRSARRFWMFIEGE